MNLIKCAVLSCLAVVCGMLPAQAAFTLIYKSSGVVDFNGGVGTAIHCTNPTTAAQRVRVVIRGFNGLIAGKGVVRIRAGDTATIVTKPIALYTHQLNLATGNVLQGHAFISAESNEVFCSIVILDPDNAVPKSATSLHMVRFPLGSGGEE